MELIDRIKVIMKVNQLTAAKLAEEIGVQRSNVSHVLSGRNKPSFEFLSKLLERFPKVNAQWLITGKSQQSETTYGDASEELPIVKRLKSPGNSDPDPDEPEIDRIVVFYKNGTFKTYIARKTSD